VERDALQKEVENTMNYAIIVTVLAALFGSNLAAQSVRMDATIPFSFHAGGATLPSGNYTVTRQVNGVVMLREVNGKGNVAAITIGQDRKASNPERNALVFMRYGNSYFLQALHPAGTPTARYLRKSKAELQLARSANSDEVIVAFAKPSSR
jgi:hypothetical protein